ncbi:hypothetical protein BGW38_005522 [Lunasporangiospora selenospora]|uniref:Uncharacterized protein n=1 Tax=Lunasporangiospora selenospora TaxID=979761 RepID=A0A9P6KJ22_9FUNG|nr:hypothetical protein BGW38_005522 [Lunasporangiospora selenospora]
MKKIKYIRNAQDADSQDSPRLQRLPDECLLLIINEFRFSFRTLYKLLTVNRLFFDESLKLLMSLLLKNWSMDRLHRNALRLNARELVLALVLRSTLQREWLRRQGVVEQLGQWKDKRRGQRGGEQILSIQESNPLTSGWPQALRNRPKGAKFLKDLDSIMREYGLTLTFSSINPKKLYFQFTTVDYSAYFTTHSTSDITYVFLSSILELWIPSKSRPSLPAGSETEEEEEEEEEEEMESEITRATRAFVRFLLQHNYQHITHLEFNLHESAYYIQYAAIMPRLKTLSVRAMDSFDNRVAFTLEAARFIRLNQETFPFKPRLDLEIVTQAFYSTLSKITPSGSEPEDWIAEPEGWIAEPDDWIAEPEDWIAERRLYSRIVFPLRRLCEAVGRPRSIDTSHLPFFYEEPLSVETENLVSLVDHDIYRWEAGEGPAMEKFFRRCHGLLSLEMAVGNVHLFQWVNTFTTTVDRTNDPLVSTNHQRPLAKLLRLSLWSKREYWLLIKALNDIVAISGESLKTILIEEKSSAPHSQKDYTRAILLGNSPEAQRIPRATTIGLDWYLPRVREIKLLFRGTVSYGSFDQCPLLESLWIESKKRLNFDPILFDQIESFQQTAYLKSLPLLSIWNLPRLKFLHLSGMVTIQFNFESFRFMKSLQTLEMNVSNEGWLPSFANMYVNLCPGDFQSIFNNVREERDLPLIQDLSPRFYPWHWSSESLSKININGPAAMMFHLEQLALFPALELLHLETPFRERYIFLNTRDEALAKLYSYQTLIPLEPSFDLNRILGQKSASMSSPATEYQSEHTKQAPDESMAPSKIHGVDSNVVSDPPVSHFLRLYLTSKLRHLHFSGGWGAVGPNTWTQILTNYAPHICEFYGFRDLDPSIQVRDFERAFKIFKKMDDTLNNTQNMEEIVDVSYQDRLCYQAESTLKTLYVIFFEGIISKSCQEDLGLKAITVDNREDCKWVPGLRVYEVLETLSCHSPISM